MEAWDPIRSVRSIINANPNRQLISTITSLKNECKRRKSVYLLARNTKYTKTIRLDTLA